ncbi:MAG: F0F1 ATP synthase subunit epsilon [Pseudomonadota bacterium]
MAATMQFDLVSPERSLASLQAIEVQIPGTDGDMTAMPDHAPMITTLRPGILTVVSEKGEDRYAVSGGFAEVTSTGTSVLAEVALHVDDVNAEKVAAMVSDAKAARDADVAENADDHAKRIADLQVMADLLGHPVPGD